VADPGFENWGAKVERRRREHRGAEGAEWPSAAGARLEAPKAPRRVEFGEGVSPVPMRKGSGENFSILSLKMATFSTFWALAHVARGYGPSRPSLDPPVTVAGRVQTPRPPRQLSHCVGRVMVHSGLGAVDQRESCNVI